jgi:nucleoside-diphosphate-sugar epimerase
MQADSATSAARAVVVNGATGHIGRALAQALAGRGHRVRALVRAGSAGRVPPGVEPLTGDAFDGACVRAALRPGDTLVHLIGTPHPNPSKAAEFVRVDLGSARVAIEAARARGCAHFVYVSVAQPAPVMQAYLKARAQAEQLIAQAQLTATVLRPWYVLGPGRRWPLALLPFYALAERVPRWREQAERLGLLTLDQMVHAMIVAIEAPPPAGTVRVLDVPAMRRCGQQPLDRRGAAGPTLGGTS